MRRQWRIVQTEGAPIYARDCQQLAIVPVTDKPAEDLCAALPSVDGFSLAIYAENEFAALLARALERQAGAVDLGGLGSIYRLEKHRTRVALVKGMIRIADGRSDPAFFGGHSRLLHDARLWESGELPDPPIQLKRLAQLEAAGVDAVEFPTNPSVDMRFARLNLAQPVAISQRRFRLAEMARITVKWS